MHWHHNIQIFSIISLDITIIWLMESVQSLNIAPLFLSSNSFPDSSATFDHLVAIIVPFTIIYIYNYNHMKLILTL